MALEPRAKELTRRLGGTGASRRHRWTVAGRRSASGHRPDKSRNGRGGSRILPIAITGALVGPARLVAGCERSDGGGNTSWNTALAKWCYPAARSTGAAPGETGWLCGPWNPAALPAGIRHACAAGSQDRPDPAASDPPTSVTAARHPYPPSRTAQHRRCTRAGIPR